MQVDTRLSWPIFVILILCVIFPFFDGIQFTFLGDTEVRLIENMQAFLLLFITIFSYFYMRPFQLEQGNKQFWLWAICWWLMLFGRSTSWGRDYFPEVPKIYFRAISVALIASVVLPLFQTSLRQEIAHKFKIAVIPIWGLVIAFIGLIISDAIEHHRYIGTLIITEASNKNLMEELYEFPLILGLFVVAYGLMKAEKLDNNNH
ncbi:hypothetical protein AMD27_11100 [Acinetobacter sp. TGL-Y2]|uniref:hypothetical protein n=1 Tax=Acinetobacter sp. TGL-Y2 TaxID=1407071 RepID=UPI0007A66096|nr:hypothetical protein [Acinetobacter sp. TGL-Y2]AMW79382.1 hypothetical protein AMD27_11100 [Acinetobacter sp. TGL-Y2]